jgi:crossover junction endodeoxyribonuclease RusA
MGEKPTWKKEAQANSDLYRVKPKYPTKKLHLSLPLPPSVNKLYWNTGRGGRRLTKQAEKYIRESRALINLAIEEQNWLKQSRHTWLYIDLVFFMPDRKVRDSHNMLKLLLDVMQGIVYENDYTVMPRIQTVEYDFHNPRVECIISSQKGNQRKSALKAIDDIV